MPQTTLVEELLARRPRTALSKAAWLFGLLAAPTLLRVVLDPLLNDLTWFELHFPSILMGTLVLGWKGGVLIAAASALLITRLLAGPSFEPLRWPPLLAMAVFLVAAGLIIYTAAGLVATLGRLQEMNRREALLNQELRHRVKNGLAMAQALASQSVRRARRDPEGFYADFRNRLNAMAEAHDQLATGDWRCCRLPDLALSVLKPFLGPQLAISGQAHAIAPDACLPLSFALHELADNATKHGALSTPDGRVELCWFAGERHGRQVVVLNWVETGGPAVTPPAERGIGSRLLTRQPGLTHVRLEYAAEGVRCEIVVHAAADD